MQAFGSLLQCNERKKEAPGKLMTRETWPDDDGDDGIIGVRVLLRASVCGRYIYRRCQMVAFGICRVGSGSRNMPVMRIAEAVLIEIHRGEQWLVIHSM